MPILARLTTTVSGIGAFDKRIAKAAMIEAIVAKYAALIVEAARAAAPVDTGGLQASIHATLQGAAAEISAGEGLPDARAIWMEFGFHHWISGEFIIRSYLRPAVEQHINGFIAEVRAALAA